MPPLPALASGGAGAVLAAERLVYVELGEALRKLIASGAVDAAVVVGISRMTGGSSASAPPPIPGLPSSMQMATTGVTPQGKYDRKAFENWTSGAESGPPKNMKPDALEYQVRHAGRLEYKLPPGAGQEGVWADGIRHSDGYLIETKFVSNPSASPYVPGSSCPAFVRDEVLKELHSELSRYARIFQVPGTPARGLEIITNDPRSAELFRGLLRQYGIPGQVVVLP
jgi:hypothetical protein